MKLALSLVFASLLCLRAAEPGTILWRIALPGGLTSSPVLQSNGNIIVATDDGTVHAFRASGSNVWSFPTGWSVVGSPMVGPDDAVYFGSDQLYALHPNGSLKWRNDASSWSPGEYYEYFYTPVVDGDGTLYVGKWNGSELYAIEADGRLRWRVAFECGGAGVIAPNGKLLVPGPLGSLASFNPDGARTWNKGVGSFMNSTATLMSNGSILLSAGGVVQALSPTGVSLWSFPGGSSSAGSPVIGADGAVYAAFDSGRLVALEPNGAFRWDYRVEGPEEAGAATSTPAIAVDGTVYFRAKSWLHALTPTGQVNWKTDIGGNGYTSPTVMPDGTVLVCVGTNLLGIRGNAPLAEGQWPMFRRNVRQDGAMPGLLPAPDVPSPVAASSNSYTDKITVTWSWADSAVYYDVMRSSEQSVTGGIIASNITGKWAYEDRSAQRGVEYWYRVRSRNSTGVSDWSAAVPGVARDADVGQVVWSVPLGLSPAAAPALAQDGTVYVPLSGGKLQAVASEGMPLWDIAFGGAGVSDAAVGADGTVYVVAGTTNNPINHADTAVSVFAIRPDGSIKWSVPTPGAIVGGVAVGSDGIIYASVGPVYWAPDVAPALYALDAETGAIIWQIRSKYTLTGPVIGPDRMLYAGSREGYLTAWSSTGSELWTTNTADGYHKRPVIDSRGILLLGGVDVHAYNPDGVKLWRYPFAWGGGGVGCVGSNDSVYASGHVGPPNGRRITVLSTNGTLLWQQTVAWDGAPFAVDAAGIAYVAHTGNEVTAIASTGTVWQINVGSTVSAPLLLGPNRLLYAVAANGMLYAIRTGEGPAAGAAWSQFGRDAQRSGRSTATPPIPAAPTNFLATLRTRVTDVRLTWSSCLFASSYDILRSTSASLSAASLIAQVHGFTFDDKSAVPEVPYTYWIRARNASGTGPAIAQQGMRRQPVTGDLLYTWNVGGAVEGAPAVGLDGTIYVTANGGNPVGKVAALNPNGTIRWQRELGYAGYSAPSVGEDGTIYVGTHTSFYTLPSASSVVALNPDGTTRWEFLTPGAVDGGVAIGTNGALYFGTENGWVYALDTAGAELWRRQLKSGSSIFSPPALGADGAIHVLTPDGYLHSYEPNGDLRWTVYVRGVSLGNGPWPGLCIDPEGIVYVSTSTGLVAVETDGTIKWRSGPSCFATPVLGTQGDVLVGSQNSFNAFTVAGSNRWSVANSGLHWGAAAVAENGAIYVAGPGSTLRALSPAGSNLWQTTLTSGSRIAPVINPDGIVYVATSDGRVHSIYGTSAAADTGWPLFQRDVRHRGRANSADRAVAPPAQVAAGDGTFNDRVRVTWRSAHGSVRYEIWRVNASDLAQVLHLGSVAATNSYDDFTASAGINYFYFVRGVNTSAASEFGLPDLGFRRIAAPGEVVGAGAPQMVIGGGIALTTNGLLIVPGWTRYLYALNPDFTTNWSFRASSEFARFNVPAITTNNLIVTTCSDGMVRVFSPDGSVVWSTNAYAPETEHGPSLGFDGTIYFGTANAIIALAPDGSHKWAFTNGARLSTAIAIGSDGELFFGCKNRRFYCLSAAGELAWSYDAAGDISASPLVYTDRSVVFGSADGFVCALYRDGTVKWRARTAGTYGAVAMGQDGSVFACDLASKVYSFDPYGRTNWIYQATGIPWEGVIVSADGTLLFSANDRSIHAVSTNGTRLWRTPDVGISWHGSILLEDGRFIVPVNSDGSITALRTTQRPSASGWTGFRAGPQRAGRVQTWAQAMAGDSDALLQGEALTLVPQWNLGTQAVVRVEVLVGTNVVATSTDGAAPIVYKLNESGTNVIRMRVWTSSSRYYDTQPVVSMVYPFAATYEKNAEGLDIAVTPLVNRVYTLQSSGDLLDWTSTSASVITNGNTYRWMIPSSAIPGRYFRVRAERVLP